MNIARQLTGAILAALASYIATTKNSIIHFIDTFILDTFPVVKDKISTRASPKFTIARNRRLQSFRYKVVSLQVVLLQVEVDSLQARDTRSRFATELNSSLE